MIAHLEGTIIYISDKYVVIDVAGVGYKVSVTTETMSTLAIDETARVWIYTAIRETAFDLYGFKSIEEMGFFELLLDVSGIGPKSALSIINVAPVRTLQKAIATGDASSLYKVSGIGKKTAEKIVIELRDKMKAHIADDQSEGSLRDEGDVIEALKALGYSHTEARETVHQLPQDLSGTSARVKEALKILGQK